MEQLEKTYRDGFQVTQKPFRTPPDNSLLDPATKRKVTICNLFSNHQLPIREIARVLDENYGHVVNVLLEQGLILERRKERQEFQQAERRRSYFKSL